MMEVLKFHLLVHSPLRPMRGLVLQYKTQHPDADCAAFEAAATTLVERWLASDVVLLFPPSQIALAAFVQAAAELNQTAAEKSEEAGAPGGAAAAGAAGASAGGAAAAVDHEGFVKELCGGDAAKVDTLHAVLGRVQATAAAWLGSGAKASEGHAVAAMVTTLAVYQASVLASSSESRVDGNDGGGGKRKRAADDDSPEARKAPGAVAESNEWT